jgi:nucleotide-binding universal stress UspA family protein
MSGIVCAIRGGPASRPTIEKAIQLAVETELPLYFLYVVNLDFLSHTSSSRTHLISKELTEMGEFILLTAQSKAQAKGIDANGIVHKGNVRDEIVNLCQEMMADYVVLGKPKVQPGKENVFTEDRLDRFAERIAEESGAEIILAEI